MHLHYHYAHAHQVIVIGSLDMALRQDEHLEGPQIYFVVNDAERAQHMQQLRWSRLEVSLALSRVQFRVCKR